MFSTQKKYLKFGSVLFLFFSIYMLGYHVPKNNFSQEVAFFSVGCFGLWMFMKYDFPNSFLIGLLLRLILIVSVPILSDEYIRFLWDGYLTGDAINPFHFKPIELSSLADHSEIANILYSDLENKNNLTKSPPLNQWIFYFSSLTQSKTGGIILLRIILIGFEIGTYLVLKKILTRYKIDIKKLSLYWLNPLVIIELTGNLYTEGVFIFFLLIALLNLSQMQDLKGGVLLSLAFCTKIMAIIFVPLLLLKGGKYRWKKLLIGFLPISILAFLPFLIGSNTSELWHNIIAPVNKNTFNSISFDFINTMEIHLFKTEKNHLIEYILFIILAIITTLISWQFRHRNRKVIFTGLTLISSVCILFSPDVYPSLIIIPLTLSLFSNLSYPLIWSGLVFLSYSWFDQNLPIELKKTIIIIEYLLIFTIVLINRKKTFRV